MPFASRNSRRWLAASIAAAAMVLTSGCTGDRPTSPSPTLPKPSTTQGLTVSPVPAGRTLQVVAGKPQPGLLATSKAIYANSVPVSVATGSPDLVFASSDGTAVIWQMNGPSFSGRGTISLQLPSPWSLATSVDLNADGNPDLVWEATDGTRAVTFMTSSGAYGGSYTLMFVIPTDWHIAGAGDFDGDTKPDLVVNNTSTGASAVVYMNGAAWKGSNGDLPLISSSYRIAAVGDMNNDTKPDIVWRNTSSVQSIIVSLMNGLAATTSTSGSILPSTSWRIAAIADFDGDGLGDFLIQNTSDGSRQIWHMNGTSRIGISYLPTVASTYSVVAARLFQWPVINSTLVNTGQPNSNLIGWSIFGLNPGTCSPQPSCLSTFAQLAAKFTLGSQMYIDRIDFWVFGTGGPMNVNIRADSSGKPGPIVYTKGYIVGTYGFDLWVPFSEYGATLSTGSYWLTFEAIDYGGLSLGMPNPAPTPQASEAFRSNASGGWASNSLGLGIRIYGRAP